MRTRRARTFLEERTLHAAAYGQGLVEYGMVISLVALACIVALKALGATISGFYSNVPLP